VTVRVSFCLRHILQLQTVRPIFSQVVTKRNMFLSFNGELDNCRFDALLSVEGVEKIGVLD
jgi:hypothetical protein